MEEIGQDNICGTARPGHGAAPRRAVGWADSEAPGLPEHQSQGRGTPAWGEGHGQWQKAWERIPGVCFPQLHVPWQSGLDGTAELTALRKFLLPVRGHFQVCTRSPPGKQLELLLPVHPNTISKSPVTCPGLQPHRGPVGSAWLCPLAVGFKCWISWKRGHSSAGGNHPHTLGTRAPGHDELQRSNLIVLGPKGLGWESQSFMPMFIKCGILFEEKNQTPSVSK